MSRFLIEELRKTADGKSWHLTWDTKLHRGYVRYQASEDEGQAVRYQDVQDFVSEPQYATAYPDLVSLVLARASALVSL
jgi:hypothetical protein